MGVAAVCTRHPSASDAIDWSASLHNFFLLSHLYTVEAAASVQLCKTGKRFLQLRPSRFFSFIPENQCFSFHTLLGADQSAVYCVGILHAGSTMAGGTSCSDITRRHKGIPYIKYSAGRRKEKGEKSSLPKLRGLGLKPRGCACTPLQTPSRHTSNL